MELSISKASNAPSGSSATPSLLSSGSRLSGIKSRSRSATYLSSLGKASRPLATPSLSSSRHSSAFKGNLSLASEIPSLSSSLSVLSPSPSWSKSFVSYGFKGKASSTSRTLSPSSSSSRLSITPSKSVSKPTTAGLPDFCITMVTLGLSSVGTDKIPCSFSAKKEKVYCPSISKLSKLPS